MTTPTTESPLPSLIETGMALLDLEDMPRLHLEYERWYTRTRNIIALSLPERLSEYETAYGRISRYLLDHPVYPGVSSRRLYHTSLRQQIGILSSVDSVVVDDHKQPTSRENIGLICRKFHDVARQLLVRHDKRQAHVINDEYDVQDLLHALLKLFFNDVRPEEWTPSYAGGSSRMDFLLKEERIVLEAKMTRKGLADREIGEQLIIDIDRYTSHAECKELVCFVYDPEERLKNPAGLQRDLSRSEGDYSVSVFISPTRS